jgi:hypothetical protein
MPRTKSHANHASNGGRKPRAPRAQNRTLDQQLDQAVKIRRYVDFVRTLVERPARNGR